jgi:hypothetical protein
MTYQDSFDFQFNIEDELKMARLHVEQIDKLAEILEEVDFSHRMKKKLFRQPKNMKLSPYSSIYQCAAELIMMHPKMKCINIP